ncbi:uncharacterized protein LOC126904397 isoform X6 [Daktulosphaira vitifoliae]|uniref:uncharacterized protein LOC126904397 isoform X6 n=1 Tax=Daktulosphaira vitifoliae TaxID=58002 RepID=UPI0021AAF930|nr:uncharacterized protein LOC126904397 isoform X6 [Daktulosphaira vitifoliae]
MFKLSSSIRITAGFLLLSNGIFWNLFGISKAVDEVDMEVNNPEDYCCVCLYEKLTVTLQPCGHMLGNICANYLEQRRQNICEICRENVTKFENLVKSCEEANGAVDIPEDACTICYVETLTVKLSPCGHTIGLLCAINFKRSHEICPFCRTEIKNYFTIDDASENPEDLFKKYDPIIKRKDQAKPLSEDKFKYLKNRFESKEMSTAEIKARYYYLRRDQEPDEELIKDINATLNFIQHIGLITHGKSIYTKNIGIRSEHIVYCTTFLKSLDDNEKPMLSNYYNRNGINMIYELLIRSRYV